MTVAEAEAAVAAAEQAFAEAKAGIDAAWDVWHQKHDELSAARAALHDAKRAAR